MNITLRPLEIKDASLLAELANNIKIWNNVRDRLPHPYSLNDAEFFIGLQTAQSKDKVFGIITDDLLCGVIGLEIQNDIYRKSAELGYWIGEPYWGNGIASVAVSQILRYGFEVLDIERIFAASFEYNLASMKVLEKNGFVKEGIARQAVFKNGNFYDEHRFGLLLSEWKNNVP